MAILIKNMEMPTCCMGIDEDGYWGALCPFLNKEFGAWRCFLTGEMVVIPYGESEKDENCPIEEVGTYSFRLDRNMFNQLLDRQFFVKEEEDDSETDE